MNPDYSASGFKVMARAENVRIYRDVTGLGRIPVGKTYWTLCNLQPPDAGSEIVQLEKLGFLSKSQFVGVDSDASVIDRNRRWHPSAAWKAMDWVEAVHGTDFDPAAVYLDTTSFADHDNAARLLTATLLRSGNGTVVFANVMLNDPRSRKRFKADALIAALGTEIPPGELRKWCREVVNYEYSMTGKTDMGTCVFVKQG